MQYCKNVLPFNETLKGAPVAGFPLQGSESEVVASLHLFCSCLSGGYMVAYGWYKRGGEREMESRSLLRLYILLD